MSIRDFFKIMLFGQKKTGSNTYYEIPRMVGIELSSGCNINCAMCFIQVLQRKKMLMPFETVCRIIDNASDIGVPEICLGGEPLLHKDLIKVIFYAKKRKISHLYFNTNAVLLSEQKSLDILHSPLDTIQFSFDGASKKTYEKIRVGSSFDQVVQNIRRFIQLKKDLNKTKPKTSILSLYMRDTKNEIPEVFLMWKGLVDEVIIIPYGHVGNVENLSPLPPRYMDFKKIARTSCEEILKNKWLMIHADGEVTVCCPDFEGVLSLGNINKSRLENLFNSKTLTDLRNKHLNLDLEHVPDICKTCIRTNKTYLDEMYKICSNWNQNIPESKPISKVLNKTLNNIN